jgi:hypothetical protein
MIRLIKFYRKFNHKIMNAHKHKISNIETPKLKINSIIISRIKTIHQRINHIKVNLLLDNTIRELAKYFLKKINLDSVILRSSTKQNNTK